MSGKVYLVGAGPGAPDLLTLRAARLLGEADVVLHDALVHPGTLALAARAEKIPVGKRCGRHSSAQRFINKRLVDAARRHRVVVRLKGGDPMLFGRAQEEIAALEAAGIEYEVVPGVTAALAAAADLGVSLTQRGSARSVAFVTPRVAEGEAASEWARTAASADTAVIYMGAGDAARVRTALIEAGVEGGMPVALVESASLENSRSIRGTLAELEALATARGEGPVVIVIGRVVAAASETLPMEAIGSAIAA
ncbi:MAG TPA: uroporphyrinogen-III C-methyltransferase [Burkholderiales bacterium]|jgi:uroporphyrin-III C-methyltransferase|nr:uroporphyrinogen-III C-methyltransferase [Burkholderiales bacterium]